MTTIGSLFSGIGGLELGLERAIPNARVAWQVEIDPFCRRVLERHWPHAQRHEDVRAVGAHNLSQVDVICGGFPCQDLSVAGRGAGLDGARSGLFFEYVRIVRALRPRIVVMENVTALLARGLGRVLGELAACGFDAEWDCVPASAVGAPHQRDRVFIVAHAVGDLVRTQQGRRGGSPGAAGESEPRHDGATRSAADTDVQHVDLSAPARRDVSDAARTGCCGSPPDADCVRLQTLLAGPEARRERSGRAESDGDAGIDDDGPFAWRNAPPAIRRMDDGLPLGMDRSRRRRPVNDRHRLKALGNAVVPQVAEVVGARVAQLLEAA